MSMSSVALIIQSIDTIAVHFNAANST